MVYHSIVRRCLIALSALYITLSFTGGFGAALNYGAGTYGSCQYDTCSISISSSGSVNLDITPSSGTKCTVASDTVTVSTNASTGYTLQIADTNTTNSLDGAVHGGNVAATSGTASSPVTLPANTWGYRVDGVSGFGAGPTSSSSNGSTPSVTFAGLPLSSGAPDTLVHSTSPANPSDTTTVWFGACATAATVSDSYSDTVTYSAVVN